MRWVLWGVKREIRQWLGVADQADVDFLRNAIRELSRAENHNTDYLQNEIEMLKVRYSVIEKLNRAQAVRN